MITFPCVWLIAFCKQIIFLVTIEQFYIPFFTFNTHWISSSVLNSHLGYVSILHLFHMIPGSALLEGDKRAGCESMSKGRRKPVVTEQFRELADVLVLAWNVAAPGLECASLLLMPLNRCVSCMHDTHFDIFSEWLGISAEKQHKDPQWQHLIKCSSETQATGYF